MSETDQGAGGAAAGGAASSGDAGGGSAGAGAGNAAAEPQGRADARYADYQNRRNEAERSGGQSDPPNNQQRQGKPADQQAGDSGKKFQVGDGVELTGAEIRELLANKAAADSKALSRPQTPDAYRAELPADFQTPEGLPKFEFNQDDPLLHQAKVFAHEHGIPQEAFSKLLGLYAGSQMVSQQQVTAGRNAEIAKLGTTGPARIDALTTYFKAQLGGAEGGQFMSRIFTASDVQIAEKLMAKMQGASSGSNFKQGGREPPPVPGRASDEEVARMSPAQRLDYSRSFDQRSLPAWRDPRGG